MRPTPENMARTREILTGFTSDPHLADLAAQALAGEGLLNPTPADESPGWKGVMGDVKVSADEITFSGQTEGIVRIDFRNGDDGAHFGLRKFAAERLVDAIAETLGDIKVRDAGRDQQQ